MSDELAVAFVDGLAYSKWSSKVGLYQQDTLVCDVWCHILQKICEPSQ